MNSNVHLTSAPLTAESLTTRDMLACPFCGGPATAEAQFGREWWVECEDCMATTGGALPTRQEAIAFWNRRAHPTDSPPSEA